MLYLFDYSGSPELWQPALLTQQGFDDGAVRGLDGVLYHQVKGLDFDDLTRRSMLLHTIYWLFCCCPSRNSRDMGITTIQTLSTSWGRK